MQLHLDRSINNTTFADYNGLEIPRYCEEFKMISGRDGSLGLKYSPGLYPDMPFEAIGMLRRGRWFSWRVNVPSRVRSPGLWSNVVELLNT